MAAEYYDTGDQLEDSTDVDKEGEDHAAAGFDADGVDGETDLQEGDRDDGDGKGELGLGVVDIDE